jgi:hypothetical protein
MVDQLVFLLMLDAGGSNGKHVDDSTDVTGAASKRRAEISNEGNF